MKRLFIIVCIFGLAQAAYAQVNLTLDTQYLDGVTSLKTSTIDATSRIVRTFIGATYRFSPITTVSVRLPVAYEQDIRTYSFLNSSLTYRADQWFLDRLRINAEGKILLDSILGQVSWTAKAFAPTMKWFKNQDYHFLNHTAVSAGLKNVISFAKNRAFILGTTNYTFKFKNSSRGETRKYGDEIFGSVGLGYAISAKILPVVEAEYSFVYPQRRTIAGIHMKSKHASSLYVSPSLIISLSPNISIRSNGRILIRRDTIAGRDAGFLWGNLEDQSKYAAQIGLQISLF